jgi:hypothetical protein
MSCGHFSLIKHRLFGQEEKAGKNYPTTFCFLLNDFLIVGEICFRKVFCLRREPHSHTKHQLFSLLKATTNLFYLTSTRVVQEEKK